MLAGFSAAAPLERRAFSAELPISPEQIKVVEEEARGSLPNSAPPPKLEPSSLTAFQLIQFNEQFEVAFFSSMLENVTNGGPGWETTEKDKMVDALKVVVAVSFSHLRSAKKQKKVVIGIRGTGTDSYDSKKSSMRSTLKVSWTTSRPFHLRPASISSRQTT